MLHSLWYGLLDFLGVRNEAGPGYGFWSGFAGDLGILAATVVGLRHLNCHSRGCWRIAKHATPHGYKLCKKCVAQPRDDLALHRVHDDHCVRAQS